MPAPITQARIDQTRRTLANHQQESYLQDKFKEQEENIGKNHPLFFQINSLAEKTRNCKSNATFMCRAVYGILVTVTYMVLNDMNNKYDNSKSLMDNAENACSKNETSIYASTAFAAVCITFAIQQCYVAKVNNKKLRTILKQVEKDLDT